MLSEQRTSPSFGSGSFSSSDNHLSGFLQGENNISESNFSEIATELAGSGGSISGSSGSGDYIISSSVDIATGGSSGSFGDCDHGDCNACDVGDCGDCDPGCDCFIATAVYGNCDTPEVVI
jgi:hypothetical protein